MNVNAEMMPFKKFVQARSIIYHDDTFRILGVFKDKETNTICKGDNFIAHKLGKMSSFEIYKQYIDWYNLTRMPNELERVAISAKQDKSYLRVSE